MRTRLTPCFALACALALLLVASPAAGSCLSCFGSPPSYCGGTGNDIYPAIEGEVVAGNDGDDLLYGSNYGNEKICGNQGDDTIYGLGGNDSLDGNGQDDYVDGGPGYDYVRGGNGYDICVGGEVYADCEA